MSGPYDVIQAELTRTLRATLGRGARAEDRRRAAATPMLPRAIAVRLARSVDVDVLATLSRNPATPPDILAELVPSCWTSVTHNVLSNPSCPAHLLRLTGDVSLNNARLANPACPADVVAAAYTATDEPGDLVRHPNLPENLLWQAIQDGRGSALYNPNTTQAMYEAFLAAGHGTATSPWAFCGRPGADPNWLTELAAARFDSHDQGTIARIALNTSTPAPVLHRIALGHAHAHYALGNPACTPDTLLAVALEPRLADRHGNRERRRLVATHPNSPLEALDQLDTADFEVSRDFRDFVLAHTRTAEQATMVLRLQPTWEGSLGDLLRTTATATAAAPANA